MERGTDGARQAPNLTGNQHHTFTLGGGSFIVACGINWNDTVR